MNLLIKNIVLSTLLLNAAPLHSESSLTLFTDSAKILLKDTYDTIKSTLSTSPYYELATTVVAASCVMLFGYYIANKNLQNPKNRFKYLSDKEFVLLAQQLLQAIGAQLESIASLAILYDASQESQYREELKDELSKLINSSKITKTTVLCNELIEEVKTRIRKLQNSSQNLNQNIDYQVLTLLKVELADHLNLIKKIKKILGLVEVNYHHSSHHHDSHVGCNSYHKPWYHECNDYWNHTKSKNNIKHDNVTQNNTTQGTPSNTESNKTSSSNPALMDTIKDINEYDILLSSFS